ncbi:MAG: hypothetical protein AB1813_29695, partial [Verrucomicrobiota bacterium]
PAQQSPDGPFFQTSHAILYHRLLTVATADNRNRNPEKLLARKILTRKRELPDGSCSVACAVAFGKLWP